MAIKDGRILVDAAEALTNWGTSGGGGGFGGISLDSATVYQGTNSITSPIQNAEAFVFYDAVTTQDWSNNEFYFLMQVGVIGQLTNNALAFRFTGATATDFIEFQVATGNADWPATSAGKGWYQFVVDIEGTPTRTGGTPPATTAIQRVGYVSEIGAMAKADNHWIDAIYRRPYTSPGIIIEGENAGSPYTWDDVLSYTSTNQIATCIPGPGGSIVLSTPIQFGNTTTSSTHTFTDTNRTLLWDDQPKANTTSYKFDHINVSGSSLTVTAGIKTAGATAADDTGSQGWTIQAAPDAYRWSLNANNNLSTVLHYGSSFSHGDLITFNNANNNSEVVSTTFLDCTELVQSSNTSYHINTGNEARLLKIGVVNANTRDNQAFVKTVTPTEISSSTFTFSNGHAIEITSLKGFTASTNNFTFTDNTFSGYSTANNNNDSTLFNNSERAITLNITGGTVPTVRNGTGADTEIPATVNVTIENVLVNSEVRMYDFTGGSIGAEIGGGVELSANNVSLDRGSVTFSVSPSNDFLVKVLKVEYNLERFIINSGTAGASRRVDQSIDRVYSNP